MKLPTAQQLREKHIAIEHTRNAVRKQDFNESNMQLVARYKNTAAQILAKAPRLINDAIGRQSDGVILGTYEDDLCLTKGANFPTEHEFIFMAVRSEIEKDNPEYKVVSVINRRMIQSSNFFLSGFHEGESIQLPRYPLIPDEIRGKSPLLDDRVNYILLILPAYL